MSLEEKLQEEIAAKTAEIEAAKAKSSPKDLPKEQETHSETVEIESNDQVDSIEAEAMKMGWDPNHQGPNKKTAEQFVKDGSFFRKIEAQNKKIDDLLKVVKGLDEHTVALQKVAAEKERIGYEKALRDLQAKRTEAVEEGDITKFQETELELVNLHKTKPVELPTSTKQPDITQDMKDWADENKTWFNLDNKRILKEADGLYVLEKEEHPDYTERQILDLVKDKIQRLHPEKFENPNKTKPALMTKATSTPTATTTSAESRLSPQELAFYKQAKAIGSKLTIEDYAKQRETIRGVNRDE